MNNVRRHEADAASIRQNIRLAETRGLHKVDVKGAVNQVLEQMANEADRGELPFGELFVNYNIGMDRYQVNHKDAAMLFFGKNEKEERFAHCGGPRVAKRTVDDTVRELEARGFEVVDTFEGDESSGVVFRDPQFWPSLGREPNLLERLARRVDDWTAHGRDGLNPRYGQTAYAMLYGRSK